jgi:2-amino-4-hydroxy-6-hydroxymethyldihydropteridine diphosphokinase
VSLDLPARDHLYVTTDRVGPSRPVGAILWGPVLVDILLSVVMLESVAFVTDLSDWLASKLRKPRIVVCIHDRHDHELLRQIEAGADDVEAYRLARRLESDLDGKALGEILAEWEISPERLGIHEPLPTRVHRAYLGIGSNLGERLAHLQSAVDGLAANDRVAVVAVSDVYETDPVGGPEQPAYLNAVVAVDTELDARELLDVAHGLEQEAHRVRAERWGPRTLDVDVLIVGHEEVHEDDLEVPHPRMWDRMFVLAPLADTVIGTDWHERAAPSSEVRRTDLALRLP